MSNKKQRGRPTKKPNLLRARYVRVNVTEEEHSKIGGAAESLGVSVSTFARQAIMEHIKWTDSQQKSE
ncbi:MAG: plasmid mobilization protein [bacterium]